MTFSGPFFSLRAFKPVLLFSASFLCAWYSHASKTIYCHVLMSGRQDATIYNRVWKDWVNFGNSRRDADCECYPQLRSYNYTTQSTRYYYWPKYYASSSASPYYFTVQQASFLNITVDTDHQDLVPDILDKLNTLFSNSRHAAAVSGVSVGYNAETGEPYINYSVYNVGRVVGLSVSTLDSNGNRVMSYPDQTGYAPGYDYGPDGQLHQVWYDLNSVSGNYATQLTTLNDVKNTQLTYDPETQQYSFATPDYSSQLSAITEHLDAIRHRDYESDLHIEVTAPDVTVNPTVTVPAPEVTVNVPAPQVTVNPTVNVPAPEVTVNPTVTVPAPEVTVNVTNSGVDVSDKLEATGTLQDIDDSQPQTSQDEQAVLDVYTGWQTGVPGIAAQCDIGLDTLIGPIPQMGSTLDVGQFSFGPYSITLSLSQYSSIIAWFRAACLACLLVLFGYSLWNIITQSLQV